MRALFEMTFARGTSECFTRYSEIAATTKMSRRNCINVMNSLVDRGFVERLEVRNDATGKGIKLRVHPEPLS
jgi:DNA-binding Lrp family transcriptional regulator